MNMSLGKKEISILLIFFGILIIGLTYYFGVRSLKEKTNALIAENSVLEGDISVLQPIHDREAAYNNDIDKMLLEANAIINKFPAEVKEEDVILYDVYLEGKIGSYISYLGTEKGSLLDIPLPESEDATAGAADVTGSIAQRASMTNPERMLHADGMNVTLLESAQNVDCTYDQFKKIVTEVVNDPDVKSIDKVSLAFDSSTGNLSGSYTINYYSLSGTEKNYSKPSTGVTGYGVKSIFGALKGNDGGKEVYKNVNAQ